MSGGGWSILGSPGEMANPKRQSPGGKTHCASQDISTSLAKTCESLPRAFPLLLSFATLRDSGRGQRGPLGLCALAAHAAPSLPAPSGQLCAVSPHHNPSLGRGDIGHACILSQSPLPDPKEIGESAQSCSVSCNASFSSSIQNKHQGCSNRPKSPSVFQTAPQEHHTPVCGATPSP